MNSNRFPAIRKVANAGCTFTGTDKILIARNLVISFHVKYFKDVNETGPVKYFEETEKQIRDVFQMLK